MAFLSEAAVEDALLEQLQGLDYAITNTGTEVFLKEISDDTKR